MIKINFNEAELQTRVSQQFKRRVTMAYAFLWLVSLFALMLHLSITHSLTSSYQQQILLMNGKTESLSPQFQKAVALYEQRGHYKNKLKKLKTTTVDAAFVRESMRALSHAVPPNFWIEKVEITTLKKEKSNAGNPSRMKGMIIKGRSFIDLEQRKPDQVREFREALKQLAPFSIAQSRLDMSNVKIGKMNDHYFHNFAIEFGWANSLL